MQESCSVCGADAKVRRGTYHFKSSALNNVYLEGIELLECPECGNVEPLIPNVNALMETLAVAVIEKPFRLDGNEIRFLRKLLGMTGEEFSRYLGTDKTQLSKWETGKERIGAANDRLVRAIALFKGNWQHERWSKQTVERFKEIKDEVGTGRDYHVNARTREVAYA